MSLDSSLMYPYVKMYVRLLCLHSYYWQYFVWINDKWKLEWKLPFQHSIFCHYENCMTGKNLVLKLWPKLALNK